jgi:hypothetical protein
MNFEQILEVLKEGKKATRISWNTSVFIQQAGSFFIPLDRSTDGKDFVKEFIEQKNFSDYEIVPLIVKIIQIEGIRFTWHPTKDDISAEDWKILN